MDIDIRGMPGVMKILFFGDIIGKLGRRAVAEILPRLKKKLAPDLVLANVENLAHGKGITPATLEELLTAGVQFCTSGNHIWDKSDAYTMLADDKVPVIRPANYPPGVEGRGHALVPAGDLQVLVINLDGRVFMHQQLDDPFQIINQILEQYKDIKRAATIVDFHAEATSEKVAFGLYLAGRVSAVVGTHTHVPTADAEILPGGTAYITDIGMVGGQHTVIGVVKDGPIRGFQTAQPQAWEFPESGPCWVNAVLLEIESSSGQAVKIDLVRELVTVPGM